LGDLWLLQIDEHLARWKSCGVKKGQILNHNVVITAFGESTLDVAPHSPFIACNSIFLTTAYYDVDE
jgi:hypothetical protein